MATIYDVAKRARVSTATVSAVLNGTAYVSPKLTARVEEAVSELNYTINAVARGLQTRKTNVIGMLAPDIAEPVYSLMVKGVERGLKQAGYSLMLGSTHNCPEEQSRYLRLLRSKQVDGMLLLLAFGGEEALETMAASGAPLVFLAREPATFEADCVVVDNVAAARAAAKHLLGRHNRAALIVGPRDLKVTQERLDGWSQAHVEAGVPLDPQLLCQGDYTAQSGAEVMRSLLDLDDPPTAVFAAGFLMMTGCLAAAREGGLAIPDDLELMTWSDSPLLDVFDPPISTIQQPSEEMGVRAAELLLRRIQEGRGVPRRIVLPTELRIRRPRLHARGRPAG